MSKYHNKKTTIDGIMFDSRAEALRYRQLKMLERGGIITDLKLQPSFELIPGFSKNGRTYRKTVYRADFSYFDKELGRTVVEDVKGVRTAVYKLKRTLFELRYPELTIQEID